MAGTRLTFEERKSILKWYIKFENVAEVQRQWKSEFQTQPPTRLTITRLCDEFDTHGTICDVHRGRSGRPRTATSPASSAVVLESLQRHHGSLLHNVHVRQGLAVQVYDAF